MTSPEWEAANEDDSDRFPQTPHEAPATPADPLQSDPARVARYAELIGRLYLQTSGGGVHSIEDSARAVVAVADEERAALVAEVERLRGLNDFIGTEHLRLEESYSVQAGLLEDAVAEVERLRLRVGRETAHWQEMGREADREMPRAGAAEAKVRAAEALADEWEKSSGLSSGFSYADLEKASPSQRTLWEAANELRAALAEAAPALPTSQTTGGGCSDAPAEQRHNETPPLSEFPNCYVKVSDAQGGVSGSSLAAEGGA
ncbi:MAG: hypothetical protein ACXVXN_00630 [Mycobacteriaceae bacterium]